VGNWLINFSKRALLHVVSWLVGWLVTVFVLPLNSSGNSVYIFYTGVLISPWPNLLPNVFCLMVRIFRLMLVLLYIY